MRGKLRVLTVVVFAAVALVMSPDSGITQLQAQGSPPAVDELVRWLDQRETQWIATAHLQQVPDAAIPRLLEPGRAVPGPHDRWTAALLTLAKIGEPAIPAIVARLEEIRRRNDRSEASETFGLIKVLAAIGPPAIPALVEQAEKAPWLISYTLDPIARMEPRPPTYYGQILDPWTSWRPADDFLGQLERALVPMLPRIQTLMDDAVREWKPQATTQHMSAAYLLARWGTGEARTRGRQALGNVARSNAPFYTAIEAIRWLHPLRDPSTAALIRLTAPRVPDANDLKSSYLLSMAIGLQQLGEKDYGPLVDESIRLGLPHVRLDAARFLGFTEDLSNVPRLVRLLEDRTVWNGRVVADTALESLRHLTLEDLPGDGNAWQAWMAQRQNIQRGTLLERWMAGKRQSIGTAPMWEANAWIARLRTSTDPRVLPLITDYLRRPDLNPRTVGPDRSGGYGGGGGPKRLYGPPVVTLLLRLSQLGVPGALQGIEQCLKAADHDVRIFGALALAAYQRPRADDSLGRELNAADSAVRSNAADFLLELGDRRGLPMRLDAFERGGELYGAIGDNDIGRAGRLFACRDLRVYTQLPLPCDGDAPADVRASQAAAWRNWWRARGTDFRIPTRAAALDLEAFPMISPIAIGTQIAR